MVGIALRDAFQDGDGVLDRRLGHVDLAEAADQRRIALDMQAVFAVGGGADAAQRPGGQGGLQQVGRVHGAAGAAGADDGVHLVDEQDGAGSGCRSR